MMRKMLFMSRVTATVTLAVGLMAAQAAGERLLKLVTR